MRDIDSILQDKFDTDTIQLPYCSFWKLIIIPINQLPIIKQSVLQRK